MANKELLSSKVVFVEAGQAIPENFEAPTAIASAIMVTERGPIGTPTLAISWGDWKNTFGGYITTSHGPECVAAFFAMGGRQFYTVRTCHYTDITDANTFEAVKASIPVNTVSAVAQPAIVDTTIAAPYNLTSGSTLDISVNGGALDTATFTGVPGFVLSGNTEPFTLANGETLDIVVDGGDTQTITFEAMDFVDIANAEAWEVARKINILLIGGKAFSQTGAVMVATDTEGTGGSIQITGGTANVGLAFPTSAVVGTGNVSNINGVTVAEIKTIVEAAVADCVVNALTGDLFEIATVATGATRTIEVDAGSTADTALGLDNIEHSGSDEGSVPTFTGNGKTEGTYGNSLYWEIADATDGDATHFNINIRTLDVVKEYHPNLSMSALDDNYFVTILAQDSYLVAAVDLGVSTRPTNGTYGPMTGGDDGLTGIVDSDYTGDSGARTGLFALDSISLINMIAVPGITSSAVQNGLINYCLTTRGAIPIAFTATPEGVGARDAVTHVNTAGILELADCAACFWPWVKLANPSSNVYGSSSATITTSPEGVMMGRAALTDVSKDKGGVYQSPAGLIYGTLPIVLGVDSEEANEEAFRDIVYPARINPIHKDEGTAYYNDGSKTLKNSSYPTIGQRRGRSKIEVDLVTRFNYIRHLPATKETRQSLARIGIAYLNSQMKAGAFSTKNPDEAYVLDAGDGINPDYEQAKGILNVDISVKLAGSYQWIKVGFSNTFGVSNV